MPEDLRDLLREHTSAPTRPLDLDGIRRRNEQHSLWSRAALAGGVIAAVWAVAFVVAPVLDRQPPTVLFGAPAGVGDGMPSGESQPVAVAGDGFPTGARLKWQAVGEGPADGRAFPVTAWTGEHYIVWGGEETQDRGSDSGAIYDPVGDEWEATPTGPLGPKTEHTAVWTGSELIVCCGAPTDRGVDAAAYNAGARVWRALPASPLAGVSYAVGVWTGKEMIVTGGVRDGGASQNRTTAAFDPQTGQWRPLPDAPAVLERSAAAVWTGEQMIVWPSSGRTGYALDPAVATWTPLPDSPDPATPTDASVVWTGDEAIVVGSDGRLKERLVAAAYDPAARTWRRLDVPVPTADSFEGNSGSQAAVWAGDRMVVLANALGSGIETGRGGLVLSYDPKADEWRRLPDAPARLHRPPVAWTGDDVIVYGRRLYILGASAER